MPSPSTGQRSHRAWSALQELPAMDNRRVLDLRADRTVHHIGRDRSPVV
jgi:hypothetical protein